MASPAHPRHPRAHFPRAGVEGSRELFDLERNARRAAEIVARRFAPQRLMRRLARTYRDWDRLLDALPRSLTNALDRVDQGRFSVHLEHQRLDTVANRLVLGLLSSALLLGSTLRWALGAPPKIAGFSPSVHRSELEPVDADHVAGDRLRVAAGDDQFEPCGPPRRQLDLSELDRAGVDHAVVAEVLRRADRAKAPVQMIKVTVSD